MIIVINFFNTKNSRSLGPQFKKLKRLVFGFQLRGSLGATFFGHPESRFTQHQLPPPCPWSCPHRDRSHIPEVHLHGSQCHVCPGLPNQPPEPVSKKGWWWHRQSNWWLEGSEAHKLTTQNRQTQNEAVPSASAPIIKALKEPPWERMKQKNIQHSGNTTFGEIVDIARQIQQQS